MDKWRDRLRALRRTVWARTLVFSLYTLVPIILAGAVVSQWTQGVLYEQIIALGASQTKAGMGQLTFEIQKLEGMEGKLLFDTDINRLGVIPGYFTRPQLAPAMLRVMSRMQFVTDSSTLATRAMFLSPAVNKSITGEGVDDLDHDFYATASAQSISRDGKMHLIDGEYYLLMAYPSYTSYLKEHGAMYLLCVQLDRRAIDTTLRGILAQDNERVLLFQGDTLIASVGDDGADIAHSALLERAANSEAYEIADSKGDMHLAIAARDGSSGLTLMKLQPRERILSSLNTQRALFLLMLTLLVIANLLYAVRLWEHMHKPLHTLSHAFKEVENGVLTTRIHHKRDDEFADIYQRFNKMSDKLEALIEQIYKQTIRTQRAELKQLQSQINPHFLYNSFFMMKALARMEDCAAIEKLTDELGEYFRYVTRNGEEDAPLEQEIAHARNYAAIQDTRFSSRIALRFPPVPPEIANVRVPRLIVQPLLENAYGHGLAHAPGKSELRVDFSFDDATVTLTVEDSGHELSDESLHMLQAQLDDRSAPETTGILNIHRRLRLRFGAKYGLTLTRSELGGLKVTVLLPRGEEATCGA